MIRTDDRTIEFTTQGEVDTHDNFQDLLDEGMSIPEAAVQALNEAGIGLDPKFVTYLSEGTAVWDKITWKYKVRTQVGAS